VLLVFSVLCLVQACSPSTGSVGAILGKDVQSGRLYVREVPPGLAAALAGVRDGDEILAIDGAPVADMPPGEVHVRLEGSVGSKVTLLVLRDGLTRKFEVTRTPLQDR
jgi:C-terminal processing protease CtpA/Prc